MAVSTDVKLEGQLMLGVPKELMVKVANDIVTAVALWGEADVKKQLYPGHGYITGNLQRSITGHLVRDFHASIDPQKVAYAVYVEHGNGRGFSGYQMFAKTRENIKRHNFKKVVAKIIDRNLQ